MSRTPQQRVDDALSQLLERLVPSLEGEDETVADNRFYEAFDHARDVLDSTPAPRIAHDETHVSDMIKRRLVRDFSTPDKALQFGNLYARLLARPVLNQKWAILYLLHQLADTTPNTRLSASVPPRRSSQNANGTPLRGTQHPNSHFQSPIHNDPNATEDALHRSGLANLPSPRRMEHHQPHHKPSTSFDGPAPRRPRATQPDQTALDEAAPIPGVQRAPTEANLLRELPFTLQGVSSSYLAFPDSTTLKIPDTLPPPIVSLLHDVAEPCLLYKALSDFLESSDGGLVNQSLRAAIGLEMRSYLGLVATLESQVRQALVKFEESDGITGLGKAGVTLKRCLIWTRDATMGLRLMALVVSEAQSKKGGQLISLIHALASQHGDPFVEAFAERLLTHVTIPFYDMLRSWIYDGELSDPFLEFFVSENTEGDDVNGRGAATSVWEDKYKLDSAMIPTIMSEEFAKKVFLIGKSLNFIRYGCGDSAWVETYSKNASRELRYGDTTLHNSVDEAYRTTMSRLIWLMNDKFHLREHLTALKKYLLLGQGDFIALLMESLASNLDRPANSQYRHTLTAQLEHAIRNSNAQHDSADVLRRLDARMLELSMGEIGWDVFTLEYKVDQPVDVIVTPHNNIQYLKVFNFLWRVKRVEYALGVTWRRCMTGARGHLHAVERGKKHNGAMDLSKDWKAVRCVIAEMVHFVDQLQYYILFEVIESSWETLMRELSKPDATLDDLISAHTRYLRSITRKGLLGSGSHSSSSSSASHGSSANFTSQLHELLKVMLAYKDAADGLYGLSMAEAARVQEKEARIESRTKGGKWGVTERDEEDSFREQYERRHHDDFPPPLLDWKDGSLDPNAEGATGLPALRQRLGSLAVDFKAKITGLLSDLAHQPDADMRFLAVVMNFNEVYKVVRKGRRAGDHRKETAARASKPKADSGEAEQEKRRSRHAQPQDDKA